MLNGHHAQTSDCSTSLWKILFSIWVYVSPQYTKCLVWGGFGFFFHWRFLCQIISSVDVKISLRWNDDNENISLVLNTVNRKTCVLTKANTIYPHIIKSVNTHRPQSDMAGWLKPNYHSFRQYICFIIKNNSQEDVNNFPPAPQNVLNTSYIEREQQLLQQQSSGSGWGGRTRTETRWWVATTVS